MFLQRALRLRGRWVGGCEEGAAERAGGWGELGAARITSWEGLGDLTAHSRLLISVFLPARVSRQCRVRCVGTAVLRAL